MYKLIFHLSYSFVLLQWKWNFGKMTLILTWEHSQVIYMMFLKQSMWLMHAMAYFDTDLFKAKISGTTRRAVRLDVPKQSKDRMNYISLHLGVLICTCYWHWNKTLEAKSKELMWFNECNIRQRRHDFLMITEEEGWTTLGVEELEWVFGQNMVMKEFNETIAS